LSKKSATSKLPYGNIHRSAEWIYKGDKLATNSSSLSLSLFLPPPPQNLSASPSQSQLTMYMVDAVMSPKQISHSKILASASSLS